MATPRTFPEAKAIGALLGMAAAEGPGQGKRAAVQTEMACLLSEEIIRCQDRTRLIDRDRLARSYASWAASASLDSSSEAVLIGASDAIDAQQRALRIHDRGESAGVCGIARATPLALAAGYAEDAIAAAQLDATLTEHDLGAAWSAAAMSAALRAIGVARSEDAVSHAYRQVEGDPRIENAFAFVAFASKEEITEQARTAPQAPWMPLVVGLWALEHSDFTEAVSIAAASGVNAAAAGALLGAAGEVAAIPPALLERVVDRGRLTNLAQRLSAI